MDGRFRFFSAIFPKKTGNIELFSAKKKISA
jgi:hypothetical protein